jgi:membrane protein YqaA with SNARE-associated domain
VALKDKRAKLGRWEYYLAALGIILTIAMAVAVVYFWAEVRSLEQYGYLGAFVISVLGGATVIIPVPMLAVQFALGGVLKPYYVALAAGAGETLGAIAIYMTGYGGGTAFFNSEHVRIQAIYQRLMSWVKRRGSLTLFILSSLINPFFYPAALAAGALRLGIWRYTIICFVGKTIKGMTIAYLGYWGIGSLLRWLGVPL